MQIGIDVRLWDQSGVGRYIRNLVKNLLIIDKNNTYILFIRKQDYQNIKNQISKIKYQNELEIGNWKLEIADVKWHSVKEQISFPKILEKENLDLMHFPYISAPIFYNKPFIITIHDLIPYYFSTGKASRLPYPLYQIKRLGYKFVLKNAILNSQKIIVPSHSIKNELLKISKIPKDKIFVTYEGVDGEILNTKNKISSTRKLGKYFLYVGNAYPHKNLETLVLSFSKLNPSNAKLIIVGRKDNFLQGMEKFADKLGVAQKIIFKGKVSDDELSTLYSNALCIIAPSFSEGFSLPVLEAMSFKCPALISDIPTHNEIAKDTCIYFDPKNAEDLKNKMEEILSGKYPNEKILKALTRSKEFSFVKMAKETLKIYESSFGL